jgi:hypothetical protein
MLKENILMEKNKMLKHNKEIQETLSKAIEELLTEKYPDLKDKFRIVFKYPKELESSITIPIISYEVSLDVIQRLVYKNYRNTGYEDLWNLPQKLAKFLTPEQLSSIQRVFDVAEVGLMSTEVSEAIEELRNKEIDEDHLAEELADIIIRPLTFASCRGINMTKAIMKKIDKNEKREKLHGRAV